MKTFIKASLSVVLLSGAITANAAPSFYSYSTYNPPGKDYAGDIKSVRAAYNTQNERFSWDYTVENKNDSFWLVVNDGPNPKGHDGELAILYGDLNANKLLAYEYSGGGQSTLSSYEAPGNLLQTWDNAFNISSVNDKTKRVAFSVDATQINDADLSPDWKGIQFDDSIGIWFYGGAESTFEYNNDGGIEDYQTAALSNYDVGNQKATVSEPGAPLLLLTGLLAIGAMRRRKA